MTDVTDVTDVADVTEVAEPALTGPTLELVIEKVRCAPFHASFDADPIGSAGAYDGFLCVEVPGPWEHDISKHEPFASLLAGSKNAVGPDGRRWRPQGLLPEPSTDGRVTVVAWDRPPGETAGSFRHREWRVEPSHTVDLCRAVVHGSVDDLAAFDQAAPAVDPARIDLMVCTHGRRDVCCGGIGTALHAELIARLRDDDRVRLWRTSHTGGHRFAPTALTFPDGYAWAHLDADLSAQLVRRDGQVGDLTAHCRGLSSLPGAAAQVADRAAFIEVGWSWLDAERTVTVVAFERSTMATTVRVEGAWPDGTTARFEVVAEVERHVPQVTCGEITTPEYGVEAVWTATQVRRLA